MNLNAITEKFTILVRFCSYFQGLTHSWDGHLLKVWRQLANNCRFFTNSIQNYNFTLGCRRLYAWQYCTHTSANFHLLFPITSTIYANTRKKEGSICGKVKSLLSPKNNSSKQRFSDFFNKIVTFTKVLPKMSESKFT